MGVECAGRGPGARSRSRHRTMGGGEWRVWGGDRERGAAPGTGPWEEGSVRLWGGSQVLLELSDGEFFVFGFDFHGGVEGEPLGRDVVRVDDVVMA